MPLILFRSFLTLSLSMLLFGCNSAPKKVAPPSDFSPNEYAVVVGRFFYVADGWISDEVRDAGFMVRCLPLTEEQNAPLVDMEDIIANKNGHPEYRMHGGLKTYYLKPGKHIMLPYNIRLGEDRYDMKTPPKNNMGESLFKMFTFQWLADPDKWVDDSNGTLAKVSFGELTVRAGEVIYFGDVQVHMVAGKFIFKTAQDLDSARSQLKKTNPELTEKMVYKSWQGKYFIDNLSQKNDLSKGEESNAEKDPEI